MRCFWPASNCSLCTQYLWKDWQASSNLIRRARLGIRSGAIGRELEAYQEIHADSLNLARDLAKDLMLSDEAMKRLMREQ